MVRVSKPQKTVIFAQFKTPLCRSGSAGTITPSPMKPQKSLGDLILSSQIGCLTLYPSVLYCSLIMSLEVTLRARCVIPKLRVIEHGSDLLPSQEHRTISNHSWVGLYITKISMTSLDLLYMCQSLKVRPRKLYQKRRWWICSFRCGCSWTQESLLDGRIEARRKDRGWSMIDSEFREGNMPGW